MKSAEGDRAPIPSSYGHVTINAGSEILKEMGYCISRESQFDYESIETQGGFSLDYLKPDGPKIGIMKRRECIPSLTTEIVRGADKARRYSN